MRIFGIDPGSERTGYGCVETDGSRHRLVISGAITNAGGRVVSRKAPARFTPGWPRSSPSAGPTASPSKISFTPATPAAR